MRRAPLCIQGDVVLLGRLHILTGLADADIGLHHHKAVHFTEGIHRPAKTVLYQPALGLRIVEVNLQVARLDIFGSVLHHFHQRLDGQMSHRVKHDTPDQRSEAFARRRVIGASFLLLQSNGCRVVLVVMKLIFQVLRGDDLVVLRHLDWPDDIQHMLDHGRGEHDIAIDWPAAFFLEDLHSQPRAGGKVARQVAVTQSEEAEIHPAAILWRSLPS